jgi:hypothetical protein
MMRVIELVTTHGSIWRIPAKIVCHDRAMYYRNRSDDYDVYQSEFDFCVENDDEIIDWAKNNMNWYDVKKDARLVWAAEENMDHEWIEGDMEVIEQPSS